MEHSHPQAYRELACKWMPIVLVWKLNQRRDLSYLKRARRKEECEEVLRLDFFT